MRILVLLMTLTWFGSNAHAYYSTLDTGEILKKGEYRVSTESNVVFNDLNGLNLVGRIDMGQTEETQLRALIGGGAVGFQAGLLYKWIPIPDYENQPAMGLLGGFVYARNEGVNYSSIRLHPLISKKFESTVGEFTPYGSIPFGITFAKSKSTFPFQLTGGTEWKPKELKYISFMAEAGINLSESFSYISIAALLRFDEENGIKFE